MYNAVNFAETTIRYVVYFTNSTLFIMTIIFDSMALFAVSLRESRCTLFWSCRNHAYYLWIVVFFISLLPYALSALSSVSFFYSPFQTHNLSNTIVRFAFKAYPLNNMAALRPNDVTHVYDVMCSPQTY